MLLNIEVECIFDVLFFKIWDFCIVKNYVIEGKKGVLSFNLGYGGVYFFGKWINGQYVVVFYVGVVILLGNCVLGIKFFCNMVINVGVFFIMLEGVEG